MKRMSKAPLMPSDCTTIAEVRSGVDAIDEAICRLIETRFAYMDAAARIKPSLSDVRDEVRKAEVLRNVKRHARDAGWSPELAASLGPKSATSPIAMAVSERLGGIPAFTAALVVCTGVFGAVLGPWIFDLLRIASPAARGFALGLASHGIGTARAFQASPDMGAFAGLAMGLNGALTALVAPVLVPALMRWLG